MGVMCTCVAMRRLALPLLLLACSRSADYVAWEAGEIAVKLRGDLAVIRYRDVRFDVNSGGRPVHRGPMYHTNVYERRGGQWQAVWSQASGVMRLQ